MKAPFDKGDKVRTTSTKYPPVEGVVEQCFDAVGGWRVIFKGPRDPANPLGLYDFSVAQIEAA